MKILLKLWQKNIICSLNNKYPLYEKYSLEKLKNIDNIFYDLLIEFYNSNEKDLLKNWNNISNYILNKLGNINIREYNTFK